MPKKTSILTAAIIDMIAVVVEACYQQPITPYRGEKFKHLHKRVLICMYVHVFENCIKNAEGKIMLEWMDG